MLIPGEDSGLQLIDIQDPTILTMVGAYRPDAPVRHVVADADVAYVTVGHDKVHVVDSPSPTDLRSGLFTGLDGEIHGAGTEGCLALRCHSRRRRGYRRKQTGRADPDRFLCLA